MDQFQTPQPESKLLEMDPFTLPELHETAVGLARTAVGAGAKPATKEQPASGYRFVDAENVVKPSLLKRFKAHLKATREHCAAHSYIPTAPLLAFHATPYHSNLDKIIENGFLVPGDQESSNGQFLPISHGDSYGPGCYLTPDVKLTDCYGFSDKLGRRQCLYCLVAPGAVHLLDPDYEDYDYDHWKAKARDKLLQNYASTDDKQQTIHMDRLRQHAIECGVDESVLRAAERSEAKRLRRLKVAETPAETAELVVNLLLDHVATDRPTSLGGGDREDDSAGGTSAGGRDGGFLHNYAKNRARTERTRRYGPRQFVDLQRAADENGVYPDGSHTRLSPDRREIIVGSSDQILPLLLITYEPVSCYVNRSDLLLWSDPPQDRTDYLGLPLLQFHPIVGAPAKNGPSKAATAVAEQWWSVSLDGPHDTRGMLPSLIDLSIHSPTSFSKTIVVVPILWNPVSTALSASVPLPGQLLFSFEHQLLSLPFMWATS